MAQDIYSSVTVHGDLTADNLHGTVDIANKAKGMIVVNAQTTSTPGQWTATVPEITELTYGMQICIRAPENFSGYATLNINSLGVVPITSQIYSFTIAASRFNGSIGDYFVVTFSPIYDDDEDDYVDAWVTSASSGYVINVNSGDTSVSSGYVSQRIVVFRGITSSSYVNTAKYYTSTGQNTDGAMTQKAITDALENAGGGLTITTYPAD